jgi:hypothetical protein
MPCDTVVKLECETQVRYRVPSSKKLEATGPFAFGVLRSFGGHRPLSRDEG